MKSRIEDKIKEINLYLNQFSGIIPSSFSEYAHNLVIKAACERYFEKIIEAVVDLSFMVIKFKKLEQPSDDTTLFYILMNKAILTPELTEKFHKAKGMRNIIVHEYGYIDDIQVFEVISKMIIPDVEEFLKQIKEIL
jgi:uncharacterized protein YutE (UPF0331/DUF86 family)